MTAFYALVKKWSEAFRGLEARGLVEIEWDHESGKEESDGYRAGSHRPTAAGRANLGVAPGDSGTDLTWPPVPTVRISRERHRLATDINAVIGTIAKHVQSGCDSAMPELALASQALFEIRAQLLDEDLALDIEST